MERNKKERNRAISKICVQNNIPLKLTKGI